MDPVHELEEFFLHGHEQYIPHHTVDCVILGFHAGELKILLLKWKYLQQWSLPGGPIRRDESIEDAASRILTERTGINRIYLQQFYTFGELNRDESVLRTVMEGLGVSVDARFWLIDRVISTGFFALVDFTTVVPTPDYFSEDCLWWSIDERPSLLFDHDQMVDLALKTLRIQLSHQPIGFNLLPDTFTMPELQKLYETVLGRPLDRRNFQKKMLSLGIVRRLEKRKTGGAHRSPYLYAFDRDRYDEAVKRGINVILPELSEIDIGEERST